MRGPRPFVFFGVFAVLIVGFLALGAIFGDGDWGRHSDGSNVTIVNPGQGGTVDGQSVAPGSVVVIDSGRRGFFPFFPLIFIPLGFLFFFGISRLFWGGRGFWRGPGYGNGGWGGPNGPGGPGGSSRFSGPAPEWFDRWHQDAHANPQAGTPSGSTPAAPQTVSDAPSSPVADTASAKTEAARADDVTGPSPA